jgi:hypothetical protein
LRVLEAGEIGRPTFEKGMTEIGLGVGYGAEIGKNVQTLSLLPRWGYFFTGVSGEGLFRGALAGIVEPLIGVHTVPSHAAELGFTLRLLYRFDTGSRWVPFVDAGLGALYEDLRGQNLGSRFLFSSGAGAGLEHWLGERTSLWASYRFRHVSNAGTASSNAGLSSNFGIVGVSFFRPAASKR